jgi:uncharacterized protein YndB with AHSA1/START domain
MDTMTAWRRIWVGTVMGALAGAVPAHADIVAQGPMGFVSRNVVVVAGPPAAVWKRLVTPSAWWSSDHTFSGSAANLTLDPVAGGCFCEKLPGEEPKGAKAGVRPPLRGGVEHMRVIYVERDKALRLSGALGPLQSEAVSATLTVTLAQVDGGTRVVFEYVVGGYMRYPQDKIMPAVDTVMSNQLLSLAQGFAPLGADPDGAPERRQEGGIKGPELDKNGLLLPRGRIWSLPAGDTPAVPAPGPMVAPLPTATIPQDVSTSGGAKASAKKHAAGHKPAPAAAAPPVAEPPTAAPSVDAAPPAAAPDSPAAPTPRKGAKAKAKSPPKAPVDTDEPNRDSVNSAFDAALGGATPAPSDQPTPQ